MNDKTSEKQTFLNGIKNGGTPRRCFICVVLILFVSITIFTVGIVFLLEEKCITKDKDNHSRRSISNLDEYCAPSEEAKRIRLQELLRQCQELYFDLNPHERFENHVKESQEKLNEIARQFKPYLPTPEFLKNFSDRTKEMLKKVSEMNPNEDLLKPKENQILSEIKILLEQHMASIYDADFYNGDWMFGPNYFCMNRICHLGDDINYLTYYFRPTNVADIQFLVNTFLTYKKTFDQYISNMKLGIEIGMVKSKLSCKAGSDAFKQQYLEIFIHGHKGGTSVSFFANNINSQEFYDYLEPNEKLQWFNVTGETPYQSLSNALTNGFSESVYEFYKYLVNKHYRHCPPDDIASGVSSLPLDYVYVDGAAVKTRPTSKTLPIVNTPLDGKSMYRQYVRTFTTTEMSPEEIFEEGLQQLQYFYPKIVNLSKEYTNETDEKLAVEKMKKIIDQDDQWHAGNFPEAESNTMAHARCNTDDGAKKYCPVRWEGIQKWSNYLYSIMARIHPRLYEFFHFTGDYNSVPNCPIKMVPHYNPSNGAMYFQASDGQCTTPSAYGLPFFLEKYGPRFQDWSVNGHEARPGHHFQVSPELFQNPCTAGLDSFFHKRSYLVGFVEGWALYAENPVLSHDVNLYKDNWLQRLGMYKWQVWRAVRLVVDTGLHYRQMNRTWALKQFEKYAWDTTDFARKEITRYMSCPGQATGYMIGRLAILKARRKAERELGLGSFDLKDFHYQILSLGKSPLGHMTKHIDKYIDCMKDPSLKFCEYLLTPVKRIPNENIKKHTWENKGPVKKHRYYI